DELKTFTCKSCKEKFQVEREYKKDREYPKDGACRGKFDQKNKGKKREEITKLDFHNIEIQQTYHSKEREITKTVKQDLKGLLKLEGFTSLKKLDCSKNQLTNLDLKSLTNLKHLNCSFNLFTSVNFLKQLPNFKDLEVLNISDNNLSTNDLFFFTPFTGLKEIRLGNKEKVEENFYNRFQGNLKVLKDLPKLETLDISNTDITGEINNLPYNTTHIYCSIEKRPQSEVNKIKEQLRANYNYPRPKRSEIKRLNIGSKIKGELNLIDFINLEKLSCKDNFYDNLDVGRCLKLRKIKCSGNQLSILEINNLINLKKLDCSSNELTELDVSNCPNLSDLDCSKNQLIDIMFAPDSERLERINIDNNIIGYEDIDKKFIKYLPFLTKNEVKEIDKKEFEQIIRQKVKIPVIWKALRLVVYEPVEKEMPETLKSIKLTESLENLGKNELQKKAQLVKEKLNSDNPILAICLRTRFSLEDVVQNVKLPEEAKNDPDQYLKTMKGMPGCYHVAVYLGNERVVHIGSPKFVKTSKVKENKALLGARNDHWSDFLKDTAKLIRYHLVIPFKRPEKIQGHLTKAIVGNYGEKDYSFLGKNCEHFANLCVCGFSFSTQADVDKWILIDHLIKLFPSKSLVAEINKNDGIFDEKGTSAKIQEEKEKFKNNRRKRIKIIGDQEELIKEDGRILKKLLEELGKLEEAQICNLFVTRSEIVKKKEQLKKIVERLKNVDQAKIETLQHNHESLIFYQVNNNQENASSISRIRQSQRIRQGLLKNIHDKKVRANMVQQICQLCEEIAELRLKRRL
ncbi:20291_t:CDS:2, partial [Funneliformis geosporum]